MQGINFTEVQTTTLSLKKLARKFMWQLTGVWSKRLIKLDLKFFKGVKWIFDDYAYSCKEL
jgi:hypothetical protein